MAGAPRTADPSRRRHPLSAHRPPLGPDRLPIPAQVTPHEGLTRLNALPRHAAEQALHTCCASRAWAQRLAAHRPYPDLDALLAAADEASYDLRPADITEALVRESLPLPPVAAVYSAAHTALAAAHAAYQDRFGHAFVVCLDDTAPDEALDHLLSALRDRLGNDREEERVLAADELRRLARGRIVRLVRNFPDLLSVQERPHPAAAPAAADRTAERQSVGNSPYVPV
ncbi:2-oxo-4-hydroxy-4-carboxy-5-ureidoimidazoline decarboxylase [Streptomyces sp. SID8367]|uniref:2-oxo-4-hydroxy-4-carboxy-5-ureidoimidazoline decarboxylase n=1 Tax=Streptomyces sp. PsTaAH-137 TaxID=1305830 RepID=UPI000DBA5FCD|nr:2-oxo-4-hydroxy-4-carboxy-5-ureidoimidazoline decarboxylase [Streptomyces sp. SID8367]MYT68677.1 2-oxo-4-hydroxy-4-carboxy-5-ureidoimidazoline decarboxylase [Streptomyces sp. SID8367]